MKRTNVRKRSAFERITVICAFAVALFIFTALSFIVIRGLPYLGEVISNEEVRFATKLSISTAFISTAICLILGIPAAYALTRIDLRFRGILAVVMELPLSIPNVMLGLSLLLMFASMPGKFLSAHGISFIYNVKGIILAQLLVNMPFLIRIVRTSFMNLDPRLETIAETLGAGSFKTFFLIMLPMAKNGVIGGAIVAWSRALGEFGATLMFVGATRMKTETLPTSIYLNMATGDIGPAMACAMIILTISGASLVISGLFNRKPGAQRGDRK